MSRRSTRREFAYREPELEPEIIVGMEGSNQPRRRMTARLALLWQERQLLFRCVAVGAVLSMIVVFLIPLRYTSTTELMPPDQVGEGLASTLAALTKGGGGDLGSIGTSLLGLRTSSDLFIGVLHSRTVQDDLVTKLIFGNCMGFAGSKMHARFLTVGPTSRATARAESFQFKLLTAVPSARPQWLRNTSTSSTRLW